VAGQRSSKVDAFYKVVSAEVPGGTSGGGGTGGGDISPPPGEGPSGEEGGCTISATPTNSSTWPLGFLVALAWMRRRRQLGAKPCTTEND